MENFESATAAITAEAATELILSHISQHGRSSVVATAECCGHIAAESVSARTNVPPFSNSAMDGYALKFDPNVNAAAREEVVELIEIGVSLAGHPFEKTLKAGECVRITTGAMLPAGSDTVVIQEDTRRQRKDGKTVIHLNEYPGKGDFVRAPGSNISLDQTLCLAGETITAAKAGLFAASGVAELKVASPLTVALISSGDELKNPGQVLENGQIYDANRYFLQSLLKSPSIKVIDLGIVADDKNALLAALEKAATADVLISSGGVSVGEADHLKDILQTSGNMHLWKVKMKPGKPLTFGTLNGGTAFFGLPGNPVSAMVTFCIFVLPALEKMLGKPARSLQALRAKNLNKLTKQAGRMELQRGILSFDTRVGAVVASTGNQDSHILASMAAANCFIRLPIESTGSEEGEWVDVLPLEQFKL